jgi:hypothetical protein
MRNLKLELNWRRTRIAVLAFAVSGICLLWASSAAEAFFYHFRDSSGADCSLVMTFNQSPSGLAANVSASSNITCIPNVGRIYNQAELDSQGFFQIRLNPYPFNCINCGSGSTSGSASGVNKGYMRFTSYIQLQTFSPNGQWISYPNGLICEGIFYNTLKCLVNETYFVN